MKFVLCCLLSVALYLPGALVGAAPVKITDDRGKTLEFSTAPQRIVSLLPSLTETLCVLEQCHRLIGVDRYSNWPAEKLRALPRVGGGIDPNVEAIVALRPDVVLMSVASRGAARLEALGIRVIAMETRTHADVQRVLTRLGNLLSVPDAQRLWRVIDAGVAAAAQSLPPSARNTRVYFEASRGPYGAGESSFIGETLTRLGVKNIIPAKLGPFPKLNPEYIVRADPDLIMIGEGNAEGLSQRPGWGSMRAIRSQRICVFSTAQSDVLVRPGPRMAEAARLMASCIARKSEGGTR